MSNIKRILLMTIASVLLGQPAFALDVKLEVVASALQSPTDLKEAPDGSGRLFIAEQTGNVRIVMPNGDVRPEPFLDLSRSIVRQ